MNSMFSSIGTKVALAKVGLPSNSLDFSSWTVSDPHANKLRKRQPAPRDPDDGADDGENGWASWMSQWNVKSLPLTIHPWLQPSPPPVAVGRVPNVGDKAPVDRDGRLKIEGKRTLVVFLRCVGCAFAQKTFLALRSIANRHHSTIRCVAVSHSSAHATRKWIDLMGGAWDVEVIIDEDRSVYAAWGLGTGNFMYLFHPEAQVQGWKEKGWLGNEVAAAVTRTANFQEREKSAFDDDDPDNTTVMGSKWQEAGAFAVDSKGTVIWGGKALRSDDMMNLEEGARILEL